MYLDLTSAAHAAAARSPSGWDRFLDLLSTPGASAFGVVLAAVLTGVVTLGIAKRQRAASDRAAERQIEAAKEAAEASRQAASAEADKAWTRQQETFEKQQQHQREMFERSMKEDRKRAKAERAAEGASEVRRRAVEHAENLLGPLDSLVHPEGILEAETRVTFALDKVKAELSRMQRDIKYLPKEVQRNFDALSNATRLMELEVTEPAPSAKEYDIHGMKSVLDTLVRHATNGVMAFIRDQEIPPETFLQGAARRKLQERNDAETERQMQEWRERGKQ